MENKIEDVLEKSFEKISSLKKKYNVPISVIARGTELSRPTVLNILNKKIGTIENFKKIAEYLEKKEVE